MEKYTIYCTEEQTKKALELGAPIISYHNAFTTNDIPHYTIEEGNGNCMLYIIPTAEQMIGWLEEHIDEIDACKKNDGTWFYIFYPNNTIVNHIKEGFSSRKEATLAAIDAALDYLKKKTE